MAFALSDLSVARDRFVRPGFANAAWGLPLYFAAQLVIASSVARVARSPVRRGNAVASGSVIGVQIPAIASWDLCAWGNESQMGMVPMKLDIDGSGFQSKMESSQSSLKMTVMVPIKLDILTGTALD